VKHDRLFSSWKILIGPSDWKEHAAGTEGIGRYQIHNLPIDYFGPGVYELGVTVPAWLPTQHSRTQSRHLRHQDVITCYVGQAENIRQRLQRYGQAGAHLETPISSGLSLIKNETQSSDLESRVLSHAGDWRADNSLALKNKRRGLPQGPNLFSEVFALGSSIAFRWAATDSKAVAVQVEAELLAVFDYAWNKGGNGSRRSEDILAKLFMGCPVEDSSSCSQKSSQKRWVLFGTKRVGITVAVQKPQDTNSWSKFNKLGNFCFLLKTRPQLLAAVGGKTAEFTKLDIGGHCGVITDSGLPCSALPSKGRKRCLMHKGMRVKCNPNRKSTLKGTHQSVRQIPSISLKQKEVLTIDQVCLPVRSLCLPSLSGMSKQLPLSERRCLPSLSGMSKQLPLSERRCRRSLSFNTWMKFEDIAQTNANVIGDGGRNSELSDKHRMELESQRLKDKKTVGSKLPDVVRSEHCGVILSDGYPCSVAPIKNRKRCLLHKGMHITRHYTQQSKHVSV